MSEELCTPKFLTQRLASLAVEGARHTVYEGPLRFILEAKRQQFHTVILVPGIKDDRPDYPDWPNYQLQPVVLYEYTFGDVSKFPHPFIDIARCKALQLWHDRNDDRTEIIPHLLFPGDTPFWGGVKRHGIVVACSGIQPWLDKLISGMVTDLLVALAYDAWMNSLDKADDDLCFLT